MTTINVIYFGSSIWFIGLVIGTGKNQVVSAMTVLKKILRNVFQDIPASMFHPLLQQLCLIWCSLLFSDPTIVEDWGTGWLVVPAALDSSLLLSDVEDGGTQDLDAAPLFDSAVVRTGTEE
jgi:hypothetical protein